MTTETTVYDRRRAEQIRSSAREAARANIRMWEAEYEQRMGDLGPKIKAPAPLEKRPERFGGRRVSKQGGSYDWFYELDPSEQARIRANWMTKSSTAAAPDEVEEHMPMADWLRMTRVIDMSKAIATGRHVKGGARYGGMKPATLIAGEPYDLAELHHADRERAARHVRDAQGGARASRRHVPKNPHNIRRGIAYKADGSLDVQYFTDDRGRIHPIRASYEDADDRRRAREDREHERRRQRDRDEHNVPEGYRRYYNRAFGTWELVRELDDDDEAF